MKTKLQTKFGLYSLRWRNAKSVFKWTPPFLSIDDGVALNAMLDMSRECPDLQNKYLCKVGVFDASNGKISGCKPIIINKTKGKTNESK